MTLDEVRKQIDAIDTQMKPLFLARMACAEHVAEAKTEMGSDQVFVRERELAIIEKRAADVPPELYEDYVTFLRHLMSVSRRHQYGMMKELQDKTLEAELKKAGLDADRPHRQVMIVFYCDKATDDLNLYLDMARLNRVAVDRLQVKSEDGRQEVSMTLDGTIGDAGMRQFLCQTAKEAEGFRIAELRQRAGEQITGEL